jgi:hypothetical protein
MRRGRDPRWLELGDIADAAPVVSAEQLASAIASLGGHVDEWLSMTPKPGNRNMTGGIYLARARDGLIKVGFSVAPTIRCQELRLEALLLVEPRFIRHEKMLQRLLNAERIDAEYFSGPMVSALIALGDKARAA